MGARVVNRLPQFSSAVQRKAARTVTAAIVRGTSELPPLVPVDTSDLLNSLFRRVREEGGRIVGSAGFSAEYALAVHEAVGKLKGLPRPKINGKDRGVYWGPHDGQPQFLKVAFERARPDIESILKGGLKA